MDNIDFNEFSKWFIIGVSKPFDVSGCKLILFKTTTFPFSLYKKQNHYYALQFFRKISEVLNMGIFFYFQLTVNSHLNVL